MHGLLNRRDAEGTESLSPLMAFLLHIQIEKQNAQRSKILQCKRLQPIEFQQYFLRLSLRALRLCGVKIEPARIPKYIFED